VQILISVLLLSAFWHPTNLSSEIAHPFEPAATPAVTASRSSNIENPFEPVQGPANAGQQTQDKAPGAQTPSPASAPPQPPKPAPNLGFPTRWKSTNTGFIRTLHFEGDSITGETDLSANSPQMAGSSEIKLKKKGTKYVGTVYVHRIRWDGTATCSESNPIELTSVTPTRIEGRMFGPPFNARFDWKTCSFTSPEDWHSIVWIPID